MRYVLTLNHRILFESAFIPDSDALHRIAEILEAYEREQPAKDNLPAAVRDPLRYHGGPKGLLELRVVSSTNFGAASIAFGREEVTL